NGDGVDAWHGVGQKMKGGADSGSGECQAQQAAGQAEQQAFDDRLADDHAGTRTQRESNGVFATAANGTDQQQSCDIDAGDQEDNRDGQEQRAQQGPDVPDGRLAQQ